MVLFPLSGDLVAIMLTLFTFIFYISGHDQN